MIDLALKKMKDKEIFLKEDENLQKLYKHYNNKKYLVLFFKQYSSLIRNITAISLLYEEELFEEALIVLRKYLETFFVIMSVLEKPNLVKKYMMHDKYLGKKACNIDLKEVRMFTANKEEGYLEYGYIEDYVEIKLNFQYSLKRVAEVGNVVKFHRYYRLCNNFVHNNLTSVNINMDEAKIMIAEATTKTSNHLLKKINNILI